MRGFRRLPHGDMHYRASGAGPVVLCLHASPRSSSSLLPVLDALADRYTAIAPDTPGYGLSDPLPQESPTIEDFVEAIRTFLDSLKIGRVAVYGTHTGAALAVAFAQRQPGRVTALALDGLSAFTHAEVADFRVNYLTPYEPCWDGSHVVALWSRVRDLYTWFPFHQRDAAHRLAHEPPPLATLEATAAGFLQAGNHYTKAYAVAVAFAPASMLRRLSMPTAIFARADDLIADHLDRLGDVGAATVEILGRSDAEWKSAIRRAIAAGTTPDQVTWSEDPRAVARFVRLGGGFLHLRLGGRSEGPPRLVLPGLPGDSASLFAAECHAHPEALVMAIDPPGCGRSDPCAGEGRLVPRTVDAMRAAWARIGTDSPQTCRAEGASEILAQDCGWTRHEDAHPKMRARAALSRPVASWDGAHLTAAWFQVRDLGLYRTPPACGAPVRHAGEPPSVETLDRTFRSFIDGPDCADLLAEILARPA